MSDIDVVAPRTAAAVTVSDSTKVNFTELHIGVSGDVAVLMADDSVAVTLKNVPSGTRIYGQFIRVMSTNTTATDIVGFNPVNRIIS